MALGEPDAVSSDERQLCYRSEKLVALWVFVASEYSGPAGGAIYRNHFYVFEFDPQGRFQSARRTGDWGAVEAAHQPLPKVAE